ncbi:MAG: type II secretion system F family protein [Oscillospiraceae bacterium]
MKNFTYIAKDTAGKTIKGSIEAETSAQVLEKINEQGWFCVEYAEALGKSSGSIHKFKTKELAMDCRQLAAMMTSGLTIVKALDILYKQQEKKLQRKCWLDVYEDVQKGLTFTEALEARQGAYPSFFISMVAAGETSGNLDVVINRLSEHYAKEGKLNNKVKSAMTYPVILGILCVVMVIGMFTFIMPSFKGMASEDDMSIITKFLFGFSDFVMAKWYILLIGVAVLIFMIFYGLKINAVRYRFDKFKIKAPMVGKLLGKIYTGRFARTLSSLYSSGIPMVECLERSSKILNNKHIDASFIQVVDKVKQGHPLSTSIQETEIFESMFCSIIYVGEESGQLDDILLKSADFYEEEADAAVTRLVGLIEPLMIIIMGAAIGLVLAGIFPMLYSNMDKMAG